MKKVLLATAFVALVLGGCSSNSGEDKSTESGSATATSSSVAESADKVYGVGEKVVVGDIGYTLTNVSLVDERNEYADTNPKYVVKVEYLFENGTDEDKPVGMDLSVYDSSGNKAETYPLDSTMDSVAAGKSMNVVEYYGLDVLGETELQFAPAISLEDAAIFRVNLQ